MEKFGLGSENLDLRKRIAELEKELAEYRSGATQNLQSKNTTLGEDAEEVEDIATRQELPGDGDDVKPVKLDLDEFSRYGRQMIMTEVGLEGQLQLKRSKVLIIGAGGLGCPAAAYLAGAGVGTVGVVDHDLVEPSNLHRQIMHTVDRVGQPKVRSIIKSLKQINPFPKYIAHNYALGTHNVLETMERYDLVLDCTDSPQTRYMISDACVLLGKPLVSASALRSDGQLVVLNNPPSEGPCYRCVFPRPPPPDSVLSCGEGGVLGPVVGAMGVLMSTEALKLLLAKADRKKRRKPAHLANEKATDNSKEAVKPPEPEIKKFYMTIYSAFSDTPFKTIRMFGKRKTCQACSPNATITKESMRSGSLDYVAFCGGKGLGKYRPLTKDEVIDVEEYQKLRENGDGGLLIDVRDDVQYGMCSLEKSINVPITTILTLPIAKGDDGQENTEEKEDKPTEPVPAIPIPSWLPRDSSIPIYFICRLGNDSQLAVHRLKQSGLVNGNIIRDVKGGLWEWSRKVDKNFPVY